MTGHVQTARAQTVFVPSSNSQIKAQQPGNKDDDEVLCGFSAKKTFNDENIYVYKLSKEKNTRIT